MANTTAPAPSVLVLQEEPGDPFEPTIVLGIFTDEDAVQPFFEAYQERRVMYSDTRYMLMRAPLNSFEGVTDWEPVRRLTPKNPILV